MSGFISALIKQRKDAKKAQPDTNGRLCRVTLEVDAGRVGDFVLDKARKFIMEKTPEGLVESFDDRQAVVMTRS